MNGKSVMVGAIVAITAFVTAAVLFLNGDDSLQRLGLLIGFVAPTTVGLLALLRADAAAKSTDNTSGIAEALNGNFDARVRNAVRHVAEEPAGVGKESIAIADHDVISKPVERP